MAYRKPSNKLPLLLHNIQEERKAGSCSPLEELKDEVIKKKWCKRSVFRRNAQLHNETHLRRMMNWRLMHEEWTKGRSWSKKCQVTD